MWFAILAVSSPVSVAYLDHILPVFFPSFLGSVHGRERSDPKPRCRRASVSPWDGPEGSCRYLSYCSVINCHEPLCASTRISMASGRLFSFVGLHMVAVELCLYACKACMHSQSYHFLRASSEQFGHVFSCPSRSSDSWRSAAGTGQPAWLCSSSTAALARALAMRRKFLTDHKGAGGKNKLIKKIKKKVQLLFIFQSAHFLNYSSKLSSC